MGGRSHHLFLRAALAGAGGAAGLLISLVTVLNLHILLELPEGYASGAREVWDHSAVLAVLDLALLIIGASAGAALSWRHFGRRSRSRSAAGRAGT